MTTLDVTRSAARSSTSLVSVVVCTRNRGGEINLTIETLLRNREPDFEIVVIDQSDDDVTRDAVATWADPRIRYVRTPTRGLSVARNVGLRAVRGEIVLMTDDDCEVPSDWVARMAHQFEKNPEAALVYCDVLSGPCDTSAGFIPGCKVRSGLFRDMSLAIEGLGVGAGFGLRRQAALDAGGFDPLLGAGAPFKSGEEHDLTYRLLLRGLCVACTDETHVVHHGFRTHAQGRALVQGYMFGYGAVFAKLAKCGHGVAWRSYGSALWINATRPLLESLIRRRGPFGFRRLGYFVGGFVRGFMTRVDRDAEIFSLS